jgi:hypothetical protein
LENGLEGLSRALRIADARVLIAVGLGIFAVGAWWMGALNQDAGYWDVFWPRALQGFSARLSLRAALDRDALRDAERSHGSGNLRAAGRLLRLEFLGEVPLR